MEIAIGLTCDCRQEIKSMTGQLGYCHSANRLTKTPFRRVVYSGLCGKVKHRLQTVLQNQYIVWPRSDWRDADVGDLALGNDLTAPALGKEPNPFPGQTYVYLTADSEYELETLREDETYVIGGIVDKNRYKVSRHDGLSRKRLS
jgi:tRNA (guanine9-N1)-methyltransferase